MFATPKSSGHPPGVREIGARLRRIARGAAIILLGAGAVGPVAADEGRPANLQSIHDLLWLPKTADRQQLDAGLRRLLETLDTSRVPTGERAEGVALGAKLKAGGVLAEEGARVVGLVRLGVDVPGFAPRGDLVWVVLIEHAVHGVTQEVWVSSTTGAVRAMLPMRAEPRP